MSRDMKSSFLELFYAGGFVFEITFSNKKNGVGVFIISLLSLTFFLSLLKLKMFQSIP